MYEEVMEAFLSVLDSKFTPADADFAVFSVIERFVVVLYDKNSSASKVNATRRELFTKKGRLLESIPPAQVSKFALEYEFVYDQVSTQLFPVLALTLISRTPFYITLIEQRTKRVAG